MDRDGVIIENRAEYVRTWEDVYIFPQALAALQLAAAGPRKLVIVTNQSGVGKGLIPSATADQINQRLVEIIDKAGGRIDGVYLCPHLPEAHCACRKPQPGLLLRAAQDLSIDLSQSVMIGDALTDMAAGQTAGVKQTILVETGRGAQQAQAPVTGLRPFKIFPDLYSAILSLGF